jgi:hypothetical protein
MSKNGRVINGMKETMGANTAPALIQRMVGLVF